MLQYFKIFDDDSAHVQVHVYMYARSYTSRQISRHSILYFALFNFSASCVHLYLNGRGRGPVVMAMVVEMAAVAHSTTHVKAAKPTRTSHGPDRTYGKQFIY